MVTSEAVGLRSLNSAWLEAALRLAATADPLRPLVPMLRESLGTDTVLPNAWLGNQLLQMLAV